MKIKEKNPPFLFLFVFVSSLIGVLLAETSHLEQKDETLDEIHVGLIFDMKSSEGKILQSCISMAVSDFYREHSQYKTRVVLHTRDSNGESLPTLSSALDLLENIKVKAIIGAQTSWEAKLLAELGDKARVPVISLSAASTSPSFNNKYPYFFHIAESEISQAIAISDVVQAFKWKEVIIIKEDNIDWKDFVSYLVDSFLEKDIHIAYKIVSLSADSLRTDDVIIEELHKLMALPNKVFILHMSPGLTVRFFTNARNLGMMSEGYAWILTLNSMNHFLHSLGSSDVESMEGILGLKSYIPNSNKLRNFTSRWRRNLLVEHNMEVKELSVYGIWAYDVAWCLAEAAENTMTIHHHGSTLHDPDSVPLKDLLRVRFKGLSGEFQFANGKLVSKAFEIVNLMGNGHKRVGFWTSTGVITRELFSVSNDKRRLSSNDHSLKDIIWPGGSTTTPKGYMMQTNGKKLRIAVPSNDGFPELIYVSLDPQTNATIVTGFCIDVFKAAMDEIQYEGDYEFIHFPTGDNHGSASYSDLIYQVYLRKYDAAVGDITITGNRSSYVDFTLPFTELGVGMIAAKENRNMWIFLKPLTADLWLSTAGFFVFTGFVIWLIERRINNEFQGSISHQIGIIFWFSFSTLVFAHREKLVSNWSKFIITVWVFVVLILTSSYTATLTSMMTIQQINTRLNTKESNIGYQLGSLTQTVISNLNFKNTNLQTYLSPEEYANALSRGSKNGGVSAIVDEIPYLSIFLAKYSADYSMSGCTPSTNGFGFAFHKGSPLVPDLSRAIAKLRGEGKLAKIEDAWFKSRSTFTADDKSILTSDNTSSEVKPLTLDRFCGLFLITGVSSAFAVAVFYIFLLCRNWHHLRNCNFCDLIHVRIAYIIEYLVLKVFRRKQTNVIHPV